jgi:predicted nuclease of predicted toxin-antitoxin system
VCRVRQAIVFGSPSQVVFLTCNVNNRTVPNEDLRGSKMGQVWIGELPIYFDFSA